MAGVDVATQDESQAPLINALAVIFVVLSTVSVALRLYTRKRILDIFGADDVTISIAQVLAIAVSVLTTLGEQHYPFLEHVYLYRLEARWGLGHHTLVVGPADALKQLKVYLTL
jgi:hypothetical protein